mmetsp:Transcript_82020/g.144869  ORF Transcript_82020/g.144869 Transcript_82020/m.144869 type:complete len:251 (-) Transcript_82020:300-1052(-)
MAMPGGRWRPQMRGHTGSPPVLAPKPPPQRGSVPAAPGTESPSASHGLTPCSTPAPSLTSPHSTPVPSPRAVGRGRPTGTSCRRKSRHWSSSAGTSRRPSPSCSSRSGSCAYDAPAGQSAAPTGPRLLHPPRGPPARTSLSTLCCRWIPCRSRSPPWSAACGSSARKRRCGRCTSSISRARSWTSLGTLTVSQGGSKALRSSCSGRRRCAAASTPSRRSRRSCGTATTRPGTRWPTCWSGSNSTRAPSAN